MPETNRMADLVGPFHDTDGVAKRLNVPVDALPAARRDGLLLGVQTSDGAWIYPVFQFTGGQVDPDLLPVLHIFRHSPPWSTAVWLCGPDDDLAGLTPVEWLRAGNPAEVVIRNARHTAYNWNGPAEVSAKVTRESMGRFPALTLGRPITAVDVADALDDE